MSSSVVSRLRIVLLGKNGSENSRVGNSILGTAAFQNEATSHSQQHSVRVSGEVEERHITVINTPHLLQTHLSYSQTTQRMRECESLSAPGPHVFVLVLQYKDFTENDRHRVKYVLKLFSYEAMKHTIVVTTDEETRGFMFTSKNYTVHDLIKECGGGHLQFDSENTGWRSEMFRRIEMKLKKDFEECLIRKKFEDGGGSSVDGDLSRSGASDRENNKEKNNSGLKESTKAERDKGVTTSWKAKLNIVLCGNNPALKNSVSKILRGITKAGHKQMKKVFQKREDLIHGRQISVIELPVLSQLSEEEVMRETHRCVSLCDPGVHLFILITPVHPLTDEDREEMKKIKGIFNSEEHFIILFISELTVDKTERDFVESTESQKIVSLFGSWYNVMGLKDQRRSEQISDLFNHIDKMKIEPYSLQMYMRVPEKRVRHELEEKLRVRNNEIKELQQKINTLDPEVVKLNLVVCGSNRGLKSFISELILNQSERRSELSSECVRRDVELDGRLISLVELPALLNTQLSEEEVMRHIHRCVSLCHPGVHVLIIIIPDAPLNNEDKAEIEEIQKIFSSRINKHIMVLIKQSSDHQTAELNEETQSVIQSLGGRHQFIELNTPVSVLMEKLQQMVEDNSGACFSTETLMEAQMEKLKEFEEMKMRIHSLEMWFQSKDSRERDEVRIVLLGKTGAGKSSTGNTILGRKVFISDFSEESVTKVCQKETDEINGRHITVIDTPGLFDTDLSNEEIQREITNCISMILPGPHVFLLLIPLERFTQEEQTAVKIIQETFGENSLKYTIVLFTRGDFLKKKTIDKFLGKPGSALNQLIEACGNRYHVFNNETEDRTQVTDLLQKIDNMVKENGDSYYSCKMFREMEREIQEQQKNILMERVEKVIREREELMKKHEEEKQMMKMKMEEEQQNHEKEKKRRENEFREREQQYKRDLKEREEGERNMRDELKRERDKWYKQKQEEKQRREEEEEKWRKKEKAMSTEYYERFEEEKERMEKMLNIERQYCDKERKRRDEEEERRRKIDKETWDEYYQKFKRERERRLRERDNLQIKHEQERLKMKKMKEEERKKSDKEKQKREKEYLKREEYKRDIYDIEEQQRKIKEEIKREGEEWDKQKKQEQQKDEEKKEICRAEPKKWNTNISDEKDSSSDSKILRILLFGRTGSGKSATKNTILGKKECEDSTQLVTNVSQKEVDGRSVAVIDTPELFDLSLTKEEVQEEILKCFSLSAPGPHAFIIVLSLGRFTPEEKDTLDMIKMIFGPKAADFCIVLFTRGDELNEQTIEEYVEKNNDLNKLISDCGNRFLAFNNRETEDQTQVTQLVNMIKEMNEGRYFTNEMFEEAEIFNKKRMKIEENERKNQAQVEELKARYDTEDKNMRKRLEEKKIRINEEKEKLKNTFRERDETLRREFEEKEESDQKKRETEDKKQSEEEKQKTDEYKKKIEEMKREAEDQRKLYEKQFKEREKEDRKREEEYKQDQEKMKNYHQHIMTELRNKQEEEINKRDSEEQMMKKEEEKEREEWMRKIKEAENDKETRERIEQQQREWEEEKKRQMREREEEERERKERHKKQLKEKQEELEREREKCEREREDEQQNREEEKQELIRERNRKEKEYEEEINEMNRRYKELEQETKEEWRRRKQEDEERRVEKRKKINTIIEDIKREYDEEMRRREREESERIDRNKKECDEIEKKHEEGIKEIQQEHQYEAGKQREELDDFRKKVKLQEEQIEKKISQAYDEEQSKKSQAYDEEKSKKSQAYDEEQSKKSLAHYKEKPKKRWWWFW